MKVYNNYINFQNNPLQREKYYVLIEEELRPMIQYVVNRADREFYDDLIQELHMYLYIILLNNKFDLQIIDDNDAFIDKFINESIENKRLWEMSSKEPIANRTFDSEFTNFVGSIKFKNYLFISFSYCVTEYVKKNKNRNISLNEINEYGYEMIEMIADSNNRSEISVFDDIESKISKSDLCFINNYIDEFGNIRTQKEVAKLLGISQQAVSKRIRKIRKKIAK